MTSSVLSKIWRCNRVHYYGVVKIMFSVVSVRQPGGRGFPAQGPGPTFQTCSNLFYLDLPNMSKLVH